MAMLQLLLLVAFAFAVLISIFAVQNTNQVNVLLLTFEMTGVPIAVLIIASAAIGATIAVLVGLAWQIRRSWSIWRERRQFRRQLDRLSRLEAERNELLYEVETLRAQLGSESAAGPAALPEPAERAPTGGSPTSPG